MPRGGRRPGAGAPKGNLNALKSGKRSKQVKAVIIALMAVPETRNVLLQFNRMERNRTALLQEAVKHYARLLQLPSRQRSINAIRRKSNLQRKRRRKTISQSDSRPNPHV